jgi:hypothetical protein
MYLGDRWAEHGIIIMYLGDFDYGSTVFFKFTTVNSSGAPTALSSGVTGLNTVQVDMSTAGFYSSAGSYTAIISSGAASEDLTGYVVAHWSLRNRRFFSTAGLETLSTAGLETLSTVGIETLSTVGIETLSTVGLETLSSAGLETATGFSTLASSEVGAATWNSTRSLYTAAGSFGQLVSTSTAVPDQWVAGPFSTHSTAGLETLSSAGLETLSSVGLETVSTVGLETVSSAVVVASASSALEAANLDHLLSAVGSSDHVVDGSLWTKLVSSSTSFVDYNASLDSLAAIRARGDAAWATLSTAGLETLSTAGLETLSSVGLETVSTVGLETLSTVGLETLSTVGLETISSAVVLATVSSALDDVTYEEPSFVSGGPSTAASISLMSRYLYSGLRNQITVSASNKTFYGDAMTPLWGKVLSEDSTGSTGVYTEAGGSTST